MKKEDLDPVALKAIAEILQILFIAEPGIERREEKDERTATDI